MLGLCELYNIEIYLLAIMQCCYNYNFICVKGRVIRKVRKRKAGDFLFNLFIYYVVLGS